MSSSWNEFYFYSGMKLRLNQLLLHVLIKSGYHEINLFIKKSPWRDKVSVLNAYLFWFRSLRSNCLDNVLQQY